jgi:hypothetical protein
LLKTVLWVNQGKLRALMVVPKTWRVSLETSNSITHSSPQNLRLISLIIRGSTMRMSSRIRKN